MNQRTKDVEPECLREYRAALIARDGVQMKQFITPVGKQFVAECDDKLVVINSVPEFFLKTADDVLIAIYKYAEKQNLQCWTVTDLSRPRTSTTEKGVHFINQNFLFLGVEAANPKGSES